LQYDCFKGVVVVVVVVVVVLVVGPISTAAMKAYCTLTPMDFRHSSPQALHTKWCYRPLLAKDETKAKEFSYQSLIHEITRFFHVPQKLGHGVHILLPLRRKACLRIFTTPEKSNGFGRD
jgi:hypothetical protein